MSAWISSGCSASLLHYKIASRWIRRLKLAQAVASFTFSHCMNFQYCLFVLIFINIKVIKSHRLIL